MFIRTTQRKDKDGETVRYLQIAHNVRDPGTGIPRAQIIHNLGREDTLDKEALARLVRSISRFLDPELALGAQAPAGMKLTSSRSLGGAFLMDRLWARLGIGTTIASLLKKRKHSTPVERAIFAMAANRALAPSSKLEIEEWAKEVALPGVEKLDVQNLYRAMDFLLEAEEDVQREVFFTAANLLNLEVDLLFFDTTSVYFECEEEDEGDEPFRKRGHSKDKRGDLPRVVIGLAVTREGPVRCWCFPGNSMDMTLLKKVKDDLSGWKLSRVITVVDRGFSPEENLRYLQRGGGHYIAGEKMRAGKPGVEQALSRTGEIQEGEGQPGGQGDNSRRRRGKKALRARPQPRGGQERPRRAKRNRWQDLRGAGPPAGTGRRVPLQGRLRAARPQATAPLHSRATPLLALPSYTTTWDSNVELISRFG